MLVFLSILKKINLLKKRKSFWGLKFKVLWAERWLTLFSSSHVWTSSCHSLHSESNVIWYRTRTTGHKVLWYHMWTVTMSTSPINEVLSHADITMSSKQWWLWSRFLTMIIVQTKTITRLTVIMIMNLSLSVAQEMLSASISQTRILQTCGVPHPNMVSGPNPLQGNDQTHT